MNDHRNRVTELMGNRKLHMLLYAVIGIMLYIMTLPYPFIFDDRVFLLNNPLIKHTSAFFDLFDMNNFLPEYLPRVNDADMVTSFALRPIAYITFRLNYILGGENPAGYRAVNIAIHIANAMMLYGLLLAVIRRRLEEHSIRGYLAIPFFAGLLFLVHPLQTESVTYVTQRFTSLGVSFYLGTLLLYLLSRLSMSSRKRPLLYLASLFALLLGMLTKEFTFTAPLTLVAMELFLFRTGFRSALARLAGHLACLAVIPAILFTLSHDLAGKGFSVASATAISNFSGYSRFDYGITQLRVVLSYFRLLALPYNLNFDPDYPLYQSLTHPEILLTLLVWLTFATAAFRIFKRRERDIVDDLVAFSVIWFPLLLCVSSSLVPLPDLMSEHRTYLPSLAFCTGMTAYVHSLCRRSTPSGSRRTLVAACAVLALFCLLTVQRNQVYSSRISLWSDTATKSPNKARPALALGNIYQEMQQNDLAIAWLKRSIQLDPDYREPYLSLGSLYQDLGRNLEAIGLYEAYLELHPPGRRILTNLALAYIDVGMSAEAVACFKSAIQTDPDDEMLHVILAEHLFVLGRREEAREYIAKARELDRVNPLMDYSGKINMVETYYDSGRLSDEKHTGKVSS